MSFNAFYTYIRQRTPKLVRDTSWYLFAMASWFPVMYSFKNHVGELVWIRGPSMYPYLNTDWNRSLKQDATYVNKWRAKQNIQRGMIISFWSPTHPENQAVKRVIAVEGDKVYTRDPFPNPTYVVPEGHVWVEGDGGRLSLDSNHYGPISKNLITGKITHVVWPLHSFGPIRWWEYRPKTKVIKGRKQQELLWT